ncbi:MAG: PEP-CTERM sorting domain-containing protein [Phycisphaerae bacterium]
MTAINGRMAGRLVPGLVALTLVGGGQVPYAGADISDTVFSIQALNESGSGSFSVSFDEGVWDPVAEAYTWSLPSPIEVVDGGNGSPIATLLDASLLVHLAPTFQIDLSVGVIAGSTNTDFYVDSALASFPTMPADVAEGQFFASTSVTDSGGGGATLMGLDTPGMGAFRAYYNGAAPDGSLFSHLISVVMVGDGATGGASQRDPASGFRAIGEDVYDMSVQMAFLLTANDEASGTVVFGAVPEPTGLWLFAVAGAALLRRRHR